MASDSSFIVTDKSQNKSVIKAIFDRYEEETITTEQVMRVLEPVLKMIMEGKFDRYLWREYRN